jgi:hypothetical protein
LIIWFYARVITAYTRHLKSTLPKFHFIFQLRNIYRFATEVINTYKDEAQTALFKDPVRTAL